MADIDIKRLREATERVIAASAANRDWTDFYTESLAFVQDHGPDLLALYDAVMSAPVGEARGCQQSWQAGGCTDITVRFLDINADIPLLRKYRLVPDCGSGG